MSHNGKENKKHKAHLPFLARIQHCCSKNKLRPWFKFKITIWCVPWVSAFFLCRSQKSFTYYDIDLFIKKKWCGHWWPFSHLHMVAQWMSSIVLFHILFCTFQWNLSCRSASLFHLHCMTLSQLVLCFHGESVLDYILRNKNKCYTKK